MTKAQLNALLRKLEGPVGVAFARAVRKARGQAVINKLVKAIEDGDTDAIFQAAGVKPGMWSQMTEQIRTAYVQAGLVAAADLPRRYSVDFDVTNPRAEAWLLNNSVNLVKGRLMPDQRGAIQQMLSWAMAKGKNPLATALDIVGRIDPATKRRKGGVIGLNQMQAQFVTNMADDLEDLNDRYFTRTLRDKRFDPTVRRSFEEGKPLPAATRQKIVERYEDRMIKHRGEVIARTETLSAINAAADETMQQVVEEGLAPENAVVRIWRHSFGANERPGHVQMNNQKRGINEQFLNPVTGVPLTRPGDGPASEVVNCRCYLEFEIDFVMVENAA